MADVNFDGFVRMTWARFCAIIAGILWLGYNGMKEANEIKRRLDNTVTVSQFKRWERDLKGANPNLKVPSITDYETAAIGNDGGKKEIAHAR